MFWWIPCLVSCSSRVESFHGLHCHTTWIANHCKAELYEVHIVLSQWHDPLNFYLPCTSEFKSQKFRYLACWVALFALLFDMASGEKASLLFICASILSCKVVEVDSRDSYIMRPACLCFFVELALIEGSDFDPTSFSRRNDLFFPAKAFSKRRNTRVCPITSCQLFSLWSRTFGRIFVFSKSGIGRGMVPTRSWSHCNMSDVEIVSHLVKTVEEC